MSRRVYVHVGAPKTGTTYLQHRLALNRDELRRHDVHYPLGRQSTHFRAALDLIGRSWGGQLEKARGEWDSLVGRVQRLDGSVIVSQEILAAATPDQVRRAMSGFEGSEVHLVYSARDLARQIPAEWQEGLRYRRQRSFARFITLVQEASRSGSDLWFWRVQGLPDVLSRWSGGLPPDRVHLVTVPQAGAPRDLLWNRFCQAFGISPAWAPRDSDRANRSVGTAETVLLRRLNRELRSRLDGASYRAIVRRVMVQDALAHRENMTPVTLPPAAYPWASEIAEEWIEGIEASGIQVVGDVNDLRPVAPDPELPWADPDHPRHADVVDAAIYALAAVITEAASRPDPKARLTARIGRVARRGRRWSEGR